MRILHLEDNALDAELTKLQLTSELPGCELVLTATQAAFADALAQSKFDVVLSDFGLIGFDGFEALRLVQARAPGTPFVFLSGTIGEELAIDVMRAGANDYVLKDRPWRLAGAIQRAVREAEDRRQRAIAEEANQRLVAILENTPDFVGIAAPDLQLLYLNRAGRRLVGLPDTGGLPARTLPELCLPASAAHVVREVVPTLEQQSSWTGELMLRAADGSPLPTSSVVLSHRGPDGHIAYFSATLHDLTAQHAAHRRIREQADLLDRASEAIFVEDADGVLTYWNHGAERILGWTAAEAIGRRTDEIVRPRSEETYAAANRALRQSREWHGELVVLNKQGQPRTLEAGFTVISDDEGQRRAGLGICTDVTEKKTLEEKFLRAQRLESIGMLATGIAHDLNNVLAPVLLGVTMLRERELDDEVLRVLGSLERSAERGAGLVRQILAFAHGIGGEQRVFEIRHLLRDVANVVRETFPRNIRVEQEAERHLWPIRANPTQIHQILLNLVVNARDAMPDGGLLRLIARNRTISEADAAREPDTRPGSYLVVSVADSGTGIPPDVLPRIWEPFFTTKEPGKGTGLGLATVRGIVESHSGFIQLETAVDRGTTFHVHLPAAETALPLSDPPTPVAVPRGNNELILVVDDETPVRELVTSILTQHGYRALPARDGVEALALFAPRADEVRLIVSDLQMPNLDGAALASVARRLSPNVKLIAASGMSGGSLGGKHPLEGSADVFLPKPFRADALLGAVHQLLRPAGN
ncbi:MAG TPA: response regulator [Candidatus Synoicihabitans sp.]|nr:response regulator [Candidatus Synoicihabitans sp.]